MPTWDIWLLIKKVSDRSNTLRCIKGEQNETKSHKDHNVYKLLSHSCAVSVWVALSVVTLILHGFALTDSCLGYQLSPFQATLDIQTNRDRDRDRDIDRQTDRQTETERTKRRIREHPLGERNHWKCACITLYSCWPLQGRKLQWMVLVRSG